MITRSRKMIFIALSAALVVSMLATGLIVVAQDETTTTFEVAKDAGAKKVEIIKA